jgi:hypothetical protein
VYLISIGRERRPVSKQQRDEAFDMNRRWQVVVDADRMVHVDDKDRRALDSFIFHVS